MGQKSLQNLLKDDIYPNIDIAFAFSELNPRKGSKNYSCECPSCGKKRAYISRSKTGVPKVACNREDSCGYFSYIWEYVQDRGNLSNHDTLKELARLANYDLDNNSSYTNTTSDYVPFAEATASTTQVVDNVPEVEYQEFEEDKEYSKIAISQYLPKYSVMKKSQKLKMVYTFIYQYSMLTEQDKKLEYYASRCIDTSNRYLSQIGFLSTNDVKKLEKELLDLFPLDDLIEFGVIKKKMKKDDEVLDRNGNNVYVFKQYCFKGFCVIPSFDLYSNTVTGLKLRNIELADWQSKNLKEPEMSNRQICYPLPFGFTRDLLADKNSCIFLVEGSADGLSLPLTSSKIGQSEINYEKANTYFIASPGVNGMSEEILGLLRGKFICLCFDQDEAGRKAAYGSIHIQYGEEKLSFVNDLAGKQKADELLKSLTANNIPYSKYSLKGMAEKLRLAGARVLIKHWDIKLGGDCNELLQNGNLNHVFNF